MGPQKKKREREHRLSNKGRKGKEEKGGRRFRVRLISRPKQAGGKKGGNDTCLLLSEGMCYINDR